MYFSDSEESIIYEATYSGDERIETYLQQKGDEETIRKAQEDVKRKKEFEKIYTEKDDDVFNLPGVTFLKFTHLKIKFSFVPSVVRNYVSKKVIFYCSLKYFERYKIWNIRRDSFPVNFKFRIYGLFYSDDYFKVGDDLILDTIFKIYKQLILWANEEHIFRLEKFQRYQQGDDVFLDVDDEELFLNENERKELYRKRNKIWRRMLPPD